MILRTDNVFYRHGIDGVDYINLPNYDMPVDDLHEFFVFCICVANKSAVTIAPRVRKLRRVFGDPLLRGLCGLRADQLATHLKKLGIGTYTLKSEGLLQAASLYAAGKLDLQNTSVTELERIRGIGPKTARFFLVHTDRRANYAILDTHILKWMTQHGYDVPKSTPGGKRYLEIEKLVLKEASNAGMTAAEFDIACWKQFALT